MPIILPGQIPGIAGSSPSPATSAPIPHWTYPLTFNTSAGVGVVQQDTLGEVFSNVQMIAVCPQGACPEIPTMGIPSPVFGTAPVDPAPVVAAVQSQEPRASETALSQAIGNPDLGSWLISLTTSYAAGDQ